MQAPGDVLNVLANVASGAQHFPNGDTGSGVWTFSNGYRNIHYIGIEFSSNGNGSLPYMPSALAMAFANPATRFFGLGQSGELTGIIQESQAINQMLENHLLDQAFLLTDS